MRYARTIAVEFNHCDPAGIVFYPRYFEMTNSVVENFFADVVGVSFAQMMQDRCGVPTARIEANFRAPSRLGDRLEFALRVVRVGSASVAVQITAGAGDDPRLTVDLTLVWVTDGGRATPWPEPVRSRLSSQIEGTPA